MFKSLVGGIRAFFCVWLGPGTRRKDFQTVETDVSILLHILHLIIHRVMLKICPLFQRVEVSSIRRLALSTEF